MNTPPEPDLDFQRIESIGIDEEDPDRAEVAYCAVDSRVVSAIDESGTRVVLDDSVVHERGTAFYERFSDGEWGLVRFDVTFRSNEEALCDE